MALNKQDIHAAITTIHNRVGGHFIYTSNRIEIPSLLNEAEELLFDQKGNIIPLKIYQLSRIYKLAKLAYKLIELLVRIFK